MLDELCTKSILNNVAVYNRSVSDTFYMNILA